MHTNRVFGTAECVLFIEVSSFQGIPIRDISVQLQYASKKRFQKRLVSFCKTVFTVRFSLPFLTVVPFGF